MNKRLHRLNGFTLTELLVIVAIIAVLIALMLPMLQKVRESSRRSACASNLSQCWKGFELHASTHGGLVPRGHVRGSSQHPEWTALIAKSVGLRVPFTWTDVANLATLHCPSHPTEGPTSHFVVNAYSGDDNNPVAGLTKLSSIRYPARVPWLLETPIEFGTMSFLPFDDIFTEEARFVSTSDHLPGGEKRRVGRDNHGHGVSNILFADGHVEVRDNSILKIDDFSISNR